MPFILSRLPNLLPAKECNPAYDGSVCRIFHTRLDYVSFSGKSNQSSINFTEGMSLLYLGVFATAIAPLLQEHRPEIYPPSQAAVILSLEGGLGVAFSIVFYHGADDDTAADRIRTHFCIGFDFRNETRCASCCIFSECIC